MMRRGHCKCPGVGLYEYDCPGHADDIVVPEDGLLALSEDYEHGTDVADIETGCRFGCVRGEAKEPQEPRVYGALRTEMPYGPLTFRQIVQLLLDTERSGLHSVEDIIEEAKRTMAVAKFGPEPQEPREAR